MSFSSGQKLSRKQQTIATNTTLTAQDSGKIIIADAVDLVVTLPPTEPGLYYTFLVETPSTNTGLSISPNAADKINYGTDDKDIINTAASDVIGDLITLVGDEDGDGWLIIEKIGTWAAEV